jgi:sterol desaturase/sphingolipid hydroxylase (fatty acid hydroxylase superfamily)
MTTASYLVAKLFAAAQMVSLLSLPSVVKPHWEDIVSFAGGPLKANVFGVPLLHLAVIIVGNTVFGLLYYLRLPFFEKHRISKKPWPWTVGGKEAEDFWALVRTALLANSFNLLLTVPLSYLNYDTAVKFGYSYSLEDYPSTAKIAAHILFFMVVEDSMFYCAHRLLHSNQTLYKAVHKFHHKWHHSVSIAAESTHPVEFVLGNVIPFATGPLLAGAHLVEIYLWTIWRRVD